MACILKRKRINQLSHAHAYVYAYAYAYTYAYGYAEPWFIV